MAKGFPPLWFLQFLDNNGAVLAGGTITTYAAGTTTPLGTFSDAAGSANANPVVLDSAGRASIYLTQDVGYKFLVKNSGGTTIGTYDNIISQGAAAATSLSLEICFSYVGTPGTTAFMGGYTAARNLSLPANLTGSFGDVTTNPAATCTLDVKKNGSNVGTVVISTGGAFTFTTTAGAAVTLAAGDRVSVHSPAAATTVVDPNFTLVASVT